MRAWGQVLPAVVDRSHPSRYPTGSHPAAADDAQPHRGNRKRVAADHHQPISRVTCAAVLSADAGLLKHCPVQALRMDIPASDAKALLTDPVRRAEQGEDIVLTRHGRVVAVSSLSCSAQARPNTAPSSTPSAPRAGRPPPPSQAPTAARIFSTKSLTCRPDRCRPAHSGHRVSSRPNPQPAGTAQPIQSQSARPMTSSRSRPVSHGSSSVNSVTHCRQEQGMRVISVPQNIRSGPNAS